MIETLGLVAAIILPLWNIPLIIRMERRRSSKDLSLFWAVGVWVCLVLMFPSALTTKDLVFKTFSIVNIISFTVVMIEVLRFRRVS